MIKNKIHYTRQVQIKKRGTNYFDIQIEQIPMEQNPNCMMAHMIQSIPTCMMAHMI